MTLRLFPVLILSAFLSGCYNKPALPVYGNKTAIVKMVNGKESVDSADYSVTGFNLLDQDSQWVNESVLNDKIYVAEFFFTSCPSICPKMQAQMLRVYEKYRTNPELLILAFTIDPARDSVARLRSYANKLGVEKGTWHFLTGNKDSLFALADKFLVSAGEDPDAPGGHIHSGNFMLIDKQSRIRGYYDGTDEKSVQKLLDEIDILQQEEEDKVFSLPRHK